MMAGETGKSLCWSKYFVKKGVERKSVPPCDTDHLVKNSGHGSAAVGERIVGVRRRLEGRGVILAEPSAIRVVVVGHNGLGENDRLCHGS